MKSRILANIWLCLLLLFSQHIALAESVTAAQYSSGDHQCALEDGSAQDADGGVHVALDDIDNNAVIAFYFPVPSPASHLVPQKLVVEFFSVVSPHYSTRAPPLA